VTGIDFESLRYSVGPSDQHPFLGRHGVLRASVCVWIASVKAPVSTATDAVLGYVVVTAVSCCGWGDFVAAQGMASP